YRLPVIFHVLYKDENDTLQYIKQERLAYLLNAVNNLYQNSRSSVDMNLEFTLATTDENGNTLATPGVEYVYWANTPMDCSSFMSDNTGQYVSLLWDPNKYINVMLYNFTSDNSGSITLGITHLPFSTKGSTYLEGLSSISQTSLVKSNLAFPYCASINSLYIYEESGEYYNSADATVTLAHELGHYIGLHHPFSENANGSLNPNCINSDYCDDTPTYDRNAYGEVLAMLLKKSNVTMSEAATREDCNTSEEFIGRNIMDYEVCYSDQFTSDQRARIRHVLAYSPLIPGPKKTTTTTKSIVYEGPLDLPILYRKCGYKMIDGAYPRFITSISDKNSWFE
ncbi:MAG: zinc-dependent metalloproteinase lipoprotein, partial [Bacteroides sp.]|nr:zinc-dependent metalloproteinase lipoprotein [Bacteroides sp.]